MNKHLKFCILVLIYLYSLSSHSISVALSNHHVKVLCPIMCKCYHDEYSKLNKVECDGRKLINPNIEAPVKTEYLDLSNNMITTLDKGSFEGLFHLTKIHMYSNAIAIIYSDTFLRLRKLSYVDLSDNRIEEIDERLFEVNRHLKTVILSYNKFSNLFNRPFLISGTIEILNLKKCHISHVFSETFRHLTKLKALDLSANSLATINVQHMKILKALNWLDLNGNPWKCDKNIELVRHWAKSNDIMIFLMECAPKQKGMFERLEVSTKGPVAESIENVADDADDDVENDSIESWLIDNEDNNPKSRDYEDPKHIHEMLTECQERLVIVSIEQKFLGVDKKYNSTKSIIFFFLGIVIGVLVSGSLFFLLAAKKTKRKWEQREYERDSRIVVADEISPEGNIEIISAHVEPPALPARRRRHPARSNPPRPKKSFFASLFERRRVYHRFHPPTLIRRLSRSNLFSSTFGLNRSESRPRLNRQCSRRQNGDNPQSVRHDVEERQLLNSSVGDVQIHRPTPPVRPPRNHPRPTPNETTNTVVATESNVEAAVAVVHRKPETPPPTYTECMITFEA